MCGIKGITTYCISHEWKTVFIQFFVVKIIRKHGFWHWNVTQFVPNFTVHSLLWICYSIQKPVFKPTCLFNDVWNLFLPFAILTTIRRNSKSKSPNTTWNCLENITQSHFWSIRGICHSFLYRLRSVHALIFYWKVSKYLSVNITVDTECW